MATELSTLVCGKFDATSELAKLQGHIAQNLDILISQLDWITQQADPLMTLYGPFIGRSILELSMQGILARIDPFRVMVVREMQRQPDFEISKRRKASVQWQGDVLSPDAPPKDMWSSEIGIDKISRSLLGDYLDHLFWREAFKALVDATQNNAGSAWLEELKKYEPDKFILRIRSEASKLYSSLSKGLHHEFLLPPGTLYDRQTVKDLLEDTLKIAGMLGIVSHKLSHCPFGIDLQTAVTSFTAVEGIQIK